MTACPICLEATDSGTAHPDCCRKLYGTETEPALTTNLADIERLALETVNRRLSIPGVQRKLSLSCLPGDGGGNRLTIVAALGGSHILKPSTKEYPGMPELEHWTMRLAGRCGLVTAESGLIRLASGEMAFVVRRFDRDGKRRVAMEDFCQLAGQPTSDKYRSSMEKAGAIVRRWTTTPGQEALRFFEVAVFCHLVGNSDMHLKNWSLIREGNRIELSPAYDLLPTRLLLDDPEESALPINGRKSRLERRDFLALAGHLRLPEIVAKRRLDAIPALLRTALTELPSPWVSAEQSRMLGEHVREMAGRLA